MSKLEEMKRMSLEAAEKVEPILIDMKSPFKPIELLQVNEKDVSWQKEALALIVYYSLHYSGNLETLSKLVA
ncbi:MAG: hypothetical protein K8R79_02035, partial [Calditrichales bacterium]|nr:hypothetical protein [Calditrichales bacterium]